MKTKKRAIKVLRIFRFQQRFELPDDSRFCRKGPLLFVREYVGSGQDDEAINYKRQIAACEANENRHILISVFGKLRDIAANYSRAYRGYILDENFRPAGIQKITGWIGLDIKKAGKILNELEQIGLIERVTMPEFDLTLNEAREKSGGRKSKSRARSRKNEKKREALKKRKTGNGNGKGKVNKKTGNIPVREGKRQIPSQAQLQNEGQVKQDPINPKTSDGRVGINELRTRTAPPCLSGNDLRLQEGSLGSILHPLYNPEARQFASEVYKAVGTPYPLDSLECRSELGCWLHAWARAQLFISDPNVKQELWDKTIAYAQKLKLRRTKKNIRWRRSPEALLRWMFSRYVTDAKKQCAIKASEPRNTAVAHQKAALLG